MAVVGVSVFELHLPGAQSLKDKRRVVKSLMERLHHRHRISVAETEHQDLRQRSEITLAVVGRSAGEVERLLGSLRDEVEAETAAILTSWQPELLDLI